MIPKRCGLWELALESERVRMSTVADGTELAVQYAVAGKNVILSSRSKDKLELVQKDICEKTGKDCSHYPIVLVDVEKDDEFVEKTKVAVNS